MCGEQKNDYKKWIFNSNLLILKRCARSSGYVELMNPLTNFCIQFGYTSKFRAWSMYRNEYGFYIKLDKLFCNYQF